MVRSDDFPVRIAVIGGGIAGLAAAHRLTELSRQGRQPIDLLLLEGGNRLGGVISTECTDGFVIEGGPDSLLSEKPAGLRLCERLDVTNRLIGTREELRRTYVVHQGHLRALPDGFLLLAPTRLWPLAATPLFTWRGKLRMALDVVLPRGAAAGDESLAAFVTRRLGREALERVAQPLVGGIYTADPQRLSLAATMPRFLEMERRHGSVIRAMLRQRRAAAAATSGARWSLFVSFDRGMQCLVDAIAGRLPEGAVRLNSPLRSLRPSPRGWRLDDHLDCEGVVLATPAYVSGEILAEMSAQLATQLRAIRYASSATVSVAYRREDVPHPLDGFGFVVPHIEGRGILACTFNSLKYEQRAPREFVLLRAFVGGALQESLAEQDDDAMLGMVRRELQELLSIRATPVLTRLSRYPAAMPQYDVGHLERVAGVERLLRELPPLTLAGSAYRGIGIPDCIASGEQAAEQLWSALAAR